MSLQDLVNSPTLQWVFVGGKGGVGKTTTSCSLATLLASTQVKDATTGATRQRKVLIISTDPAHNLSDAFNQKLQKTPTKIDGMETLYGMEIDPSSVTNTTYAENFKLDGNLDKEQADGLKDVANILRHAATSLPGIDEVTVFAEIMREIRKLSFDTVVFDTAPTGHTLRLLALPQTLNDSLDKFLNVQGIGSLVQTASQFVGNATGMTSDEMSSKLDKWRNEVKEVQAQFSDNAKTTFVCVCIPEFLSVYETERLIQELMKYNISCDNIVVNQLVLKPSSEPSCRMCESRQRIQQKYLGQIDELYEDFHIVRMPLHGAEVRGVAALKRFSNFLTESYDADKHGYL